MNRAKTLVGTAILATVGAWPLATFAQSSAGTTGSGTPSDSARATTGNQPSGQSMSPATGAGYPASRDMTTGQQRGAGWSGDGLVGPYVGASVGLSNYSDDSCVGDCDKTDWGGKIFGGYMFTPWVGVELDYGWFGKTKINTTSRIGTSTVNSTAEIKTDGWSGFLVGQYPVDNFTPFAKIGFARLNTSVSGAINGRPVVDNNDSSFEFAWGLGVGWKFDRNLGLRAEYESRRYQYEGNAEDLGFWSVGLQYRF